MIKVKVLLTHFKVICGKAPQPDPNLMGPKMGLSLLMQGLSLWRLATSFTCVLLVLLLQVLLVLLLACFTCFTASLSHSCY